MVSDDINIIEDYYNNKKNFKEEVEMFVEDLNNIYNKKVTIKDFSEDELFDLYLCRRKYAANIKSNLFDLKLTFKSIYLPYFISIFGIIATSNEFGREMRESIPIHLIITFLITIVFILSFYKKLKKKLIEFIIMN